MTNRDSTTDGDAKPLDDAAGAKDAVQQPISGRAIAAVALGVASLACSCVTGVPAALVGWSALRQIKQSDGALGGKSLALIGILLGLGSTTLTLAAGGWLGWEARGLALATHNLKAVSMALHNYHDTHRVFPMTGVEFERGGDRVIREQLSWRVRLLPYLDEMELYEQFDFNQPWDSPQNLALIEKMPAWYATPGRSTPVGETRVQAIVFPRDPRTITDVAPETLRDYGRATAFDLAYGESMRRGSASAASYGDFLDGTSNSIIVVEADTPVIWTKPDDWELDFHEPKRDLGGVRFGGFLTIFADNNVRLLPANIDGESVLRLASIRDGNRLEIQWERADDE